MADCTQLCPSTEVDGGTFTFTTRDSPHDFVFAIPAGVYLDFFFTMNHTLSGLSPGFFILLQWQGTDNGFFFGQTVMFAESTNVTDKKRDFGFSARPPTTLAAINAAAGGNLTITVKITGNSSFTSDVINCFVLHLFSCVDDDSSLGTGDCDTFCTVGQITPLQNLPIPYYEKWGIYHLVNTTEVLEILSSHPSGWTVSAPDSCGRIIVCAPCYPNVSGAPPPTPGDTIGKYRVYYNQGIRNDFSYNIRRSERFYLVYDVLCNPTGSPGPGNGAVANPYKLQDKYGNYHATGLDAATEGTGLYWRSDSTIPKPSWANVGVSLPFGNKCSDPRVERDFRGLLYAVGTEHKTATTSWNVLLSRSDDDGATWNSATTALTSCKHGTIVEGHNGGLFVAGWCHTNSVIMGIFQGTGDTSFSTPYPFLAGTTTLTAADDVFQFCAEWEEPGRYILHYSGTTATSTLRRSADDGRTWDTAAATMAGKHPTVAHFGGITFAAVYSGTQIVAMRQEPGATAFTTPTAIKGTSTAALGFQDDTFHFMGCYDEPGRVVLHALESGQSRTTHLQSGDDAQSFLRIT